jgi:hypothetical protein
MSVSHEGETCRGSGDGPTGRLGIQPPRDATGGVGRATAYGRWVLQTRVFRRALRGLGALCDNGVPEGLLVERMHLGWLHVLMGRGAAHALTLDRTDVRPRAADGAARGPERSVTREQERTLEHASAHGDELPVERVAIALHQSCSPPSRQVGRSEARTIQVTRAEPQVRLAPQPGSNLTSRAP